jgi:hypothetical protein
MVEQERDNLNQHDLSKECCKMLQSIIEDKYPDTSHKINRKEEIKRLLNPPILLVFPRLKIIKKLKSNKNKFTGESGNEQFCLEESEPKLTTLTKMTRNKFGLYDDFLTIKKSDSIRIKKNINDIMKKYKIEIK